MWAVRLQSVRPVGPTDLTDQSDQPVGPTIVPCKRPVKELVDALLPYVTATVNASLREGRLPPSQKHAVFTPLQKNPGLDADDLKNYLGRSPT